MARVHRCAVPDCDRTPRQKWMRLCDRCFAVLPLDVRNDLANVRRYADLPKNERDRRFRKAQREARDFMARRKAEQDAAAAEAFNRTQDLLGEKN